MKSVVKRILALVTALVIFTLVACSNSTGPSGSEATSSNTSEQERSESTPPPLSSTSEIEGSTAQSNNQAVTFPSSDNGKTEFNADAYDITPFDLSVDFPADWTMKERESATGNNADTVLGLAAVWSVHDIYDGAGEHIGAVGYNTYEEYEGAEDMPQAIYSQIALGNNYKFDVRDSYIVIAEAESGLTATCDIDYGASINNGTEKKNKGIVSYNRDLLVYVAFEFISDQITDEQTENIAKSIELTGEFAKQTPENNKYGVKFFIAPTMTDEQQAFYTDYVGKLAYSVLLLIDWSGDEFASISYEPSGAFTGSYLILAFEDIVGYDEMKKLFERYNGKFPAEVVEEVLLKYFPFTVEQLHEILAYHYKADTNTYYYEGGRGGGPAETAVVSVSHEADGSVRLGYEFYNGYSGLDYTPDSYQYKTPGVVTLKPNAGGGYKIWSVEVGEQIEAPKAN